MSIINTKSPQFPKRLADFKNKHEGKVVVKGVQIELDRSNQPPKTTYHRKMMEELQNKFLEIDSLVELIDGVINDNDITVEAKNTRLDSILSELSKLKSNCEIQNWITHFLNDTDNTQNKAKAIRLNAAYLKTHHYVNLRSINMESGPQSDNSKKPELQDKSKGNKGIGKNKPLNKAYSIYQTPENPNSIRLDELSPPAEKEISLGIQQNNTDPKLLHQTAEEITKFIGSLDEIAKTYTLQDSYTLEQFQADTISERVNAYMNESNTVEGTAGFFNDFDQVEAFQDDKAKIFAVFQKFNDSDKSINKPASQNLKQETLDDSQLTTLMNIGTELKKIEKDHGSIKDFCNKLKAESLESEIIYTHSKDHQQRKIYSFNEKNELELKKESVPIEKFTIHLNKNGSICIKMAQPSQNFGNADYGQVLTNITTDAKLQKLVEFIDKETNSTFAKSNQPISSPVEMQNIDKKVMKSSQEDDVKTIEGLPQEIEQISTTPIYEAPKIKLNSKIYNLLVNRAINLILNLLKIVPNSFISLIKNANATTSNTTQNTSNNSTQDNQNKIEIKANELARTLINLITIKDEFYPNQENIKLLKEIEYELRKELGLVNGKIEAFANHQDATSIPEANVHIGYDMEKKQVSKLLANEVKNIDIQLIPAIDMLNQFDKDGKRIVNG